MFLHDVTWSLHRRVCAEEDPNPLLSSLIRNRDRSRSPYHSRDPARIRPDPNSAWLDTEGTAPNGWKWK